MRDSQNGSIAASSRKTDFKINLSLTLSLLALSSTLFVVGEVVLFLFHTSVLPQSGRFLALSRGDTLAVPSRRSLVVRLEH